MIGRAKGTRETSPLGVIRGLCTFGEIGRYNALASSPRVTTGNGKSAEHAQ